MTSNYRIVRPQGSSDRLSLELVWYNKAGVPCDVSAGGINFNCDIREGPGKILEDLESALRSARELPVITFEEIMAGEYDPEDEFDPSQITLVIGDKQFAFVNDELVEV